MKRFTAAVLPIFIVFILFDAANAATARPSGAASRATPQSRSSAAGVPSAQASSGVTVQAAAPAQQVEIETEQETVVEAANCQADYRECMDQFCLRDATEGERCVCSETVNFSAFQKIIQETEKIQSEAQRIYSEDVERAELGAKASEVFNDKDLAKKRDCEKRGWNWDESRQRCRRPSLLNNDFDSGEIDLDEPSYRDVHKLCEPKLDKCTDNEKSMQISLYKNQIANDCKAYDTYLKDEKRTAETNKRIAEQSVRAKRVQHWDRDNKYNHAQCFTVYTDCMRVIAGCGDNFENCICDRDPVGNIEGTCDDEKMLARRQESCDYVLEECQRSSAAVKAQFKSETPQFIRGAERYIAENFATTCRSRTWACLEDNCSYSTSSQCLDNIRIAAGICPIITRCNELIPGFEDSFKDQLKSFAIDFCENDIGKCLRNACGEDFTAPQCIGRKLSEITALCPKDRTPACKNISDSQFSTMQSGAVWRLEWQLREGCINLFSEQLGNICAPDMVNCVNSMPQIDSASTLQELEALLTHSTKDGMTTTQLEDYADAQVEAIVGRLQEDATSANCRSSIGNEVFAGAREAARMQARSRLKRQYQTKRAELAKSESAAEKREYCENNKMGLNKGEEPAGDKNGTWISSMVFEEALMNCKVMRHQRVCASSGESKATNALKAGAGMAVAGASMGKMAGPWGAVIGGVVGIGGGIAAGMSAGGEKVQCQDIDVPENYAM
ncbi:MAG: hypothetical protein FWG80_02800 [Alphaproteobacteria bacterium]|nr:hypothetical protein [Alphaproteobacteria bacterium]